MWDVLILAYNQCQKVKTEGQKTNYKGNYSNYFYISEGSAISTVNRK